MLSVNVICEFQPSNSAFQNKLYQDIRKIRKDNELFVPADKTTNFYRVKPETYKQLLHNNIHKNLQESAIKQHSRNHQGRKENRETPQTRQQNCRNGRERMLYHIKRPQTELWQQPNITPHQSCQIRNRYREEKNPRRNSDSVIEWFKNINNKSSHSFINFDVVDFYPSITDELLNKALQR